MIRRGRWAHNDAAVAIRFDTSFDFPQFRISKNFFPAPEVKCRLLLPRSKF
jgi:hypothetical protein